MKIGPALAFAVASLLASSAAPTASGPNPAPASQFIAWPGNPNEGLIIPRDSPVRFRAFGKHEIAHFDGRFVLTGTYSYGCAIDCEGPQADKFFRFDVVPDPAIAARLPHWKLHDNDIRIVVGRESRLVRAVATPQQRAALRSGKLGDVRGRITIVVDEFETGLACESAYYAARFVSLAKAPTLAEVEPDGNYGCG